MLAEDVFAGLTWLLEHASELEVDLARVAIMGIVPEAKLPLRWQSSLVTAR
jgi:hypothetical protein